MKMPSKLNSTIAIAVTAVLFAACSSAPVKPNGAESARSKLTALQSDPQLSSRAPVAIKEADMAVRAAEAPQAKKNMELGKHLVLIADRKVETASAQAQTHWLEDQRKSLSEQQQTARLEARTREAEKARGDADTARSDATLARRDEDAARAEAGQARADAEISRIQADVARSDTALAKQQSDALQRTAKLESDELQRQITALNAKTTERGLVVTLGDVLFSTGRSDLKGGAQNNLAKLSSFLNKYPDSNVMIEGHTDSMGSDDMNQSLSQRRAESVKSYLMSQGVAASRLSANGKGEGAPIAGNDSATGRQQNRRVEVIIVNTKIAAVSESSGKVLADTQ